MTWEVVNKIVLILKNMLLQMKINGRIEIKVFYLFGTQNILDFDFLISQLDIDFFFFPS